MLGTCPICFCPNFSMLIHGRDPCYSNSDTYCMNSVYFKESRDQSSENIFQHMKCMPTFHCILMIFFMKSLQKKCIAPLKMSVLKVSNTKYTCFIHAVLFMFESRRNIGFQRMHFLCDTLYDIFHRLCVCRLLPCYLFHVILIKAHNYSFKHYHCPQCTARQTTTGAPMSVTFLCYYMGTFETLHWILFRIK